VTERPTTADELAAPVVERLRAVADALDGPAEAFDALVADLFAELACVAGRAGDAD
jgi:hypothetical protein